MRKEVGIIGLGKMGGNVARRLTKLGWHVVGYNRTQEDTKELEREGIDGAYSLEEFIKKLSRPRIILTILTSGKPTEEVIGSLLKYFDQGDIIIEAANSFYTDSIRRAKLVEKKGIKFIDLGISGGPGGALNGACLMVGGDSRLFDYLKPLFEDMALRFRSGQAKQDAAGPVPDSESLWTRRERPLARRAVAHFEGIGAGHFVKMVHNGIEYGMMQSIAEGFNLLKNGPYKLDLLEVARIYNNGSVVESRLVGWLQDAFGKFGQELAGVSGSVGYTGEGEWTAKTAKELGLPAKVIEESVKFRMKSQKKPSFVGKILTGMRSQFGGHTTQSGKMT